MASFLGQASKEFLPPQYIHAPSFSRLALSSAFKLPVAGSNTFEIPSGVFDLALGLLEDDWVGFPEGGDFSKPSSKDSTCSWLIPSSLGTLKGDLTPCWPVEVHARWCRGQGSAQLTLEELENVCHEGKAD